MTDQSGGSFRIEAVGPDDTPAGWASVLPVDVRFPGAWVRVAGIAGVGTARTLRQRGVFRRVMAEAHRRIVERGYPVSLLFGIPHLYHKVGYATTHAEHCILLKVRDVDGEIGRLPARGALRQLDPDDWPAVLEMYHRAVQDKPGAIRRDPGRFRGFPRGPRIGYGVEGVGVFDGAKLVAYGVFDTLPQDAVTAMRCDLYEVHLSEVIAEDPVAAGELLREAVRRAKERQVEKIHVHVPPDHPVARFLRLFGTEEITTIPRSGGGMMRVMSPEGLLRQLAGAWQEALKEGARANRLPWSGTMELAIPDSPVPDHPATPALVRIGPSGDVDVVRRGPPGGEAANGGLPRRRAAHDDTPSASLSVDSGALAQLLLGFASLTDLRATGKARVSGDERGLDELFRIVAPPATPYAYHATHF